MKCPGFISVHVFRQVLAATATSLHSLSAGTVFGHSAVLLPQLKEDQTILYDAAYDSWIASISPLSMVLGCLIAGSIIDRFGRRVGLIFFSIPFVLGWIVMGLSCNVNLLLLGRAVTGVSTGAFRPMSIVYISEVSDPKHRSMLLVSTSLSTNIGILLCHSVGVYLYWKTAIIVFCVPILLAVVILLCLKESPLWLITKGKSDEGCVNFYWFRAKTEAADNELKAVLNKQKNKSQDLNIKDTFKVIFSKAFLVPLAICFVIFTEVQFCGTHVLNFYALYLIKSTFSDNVDSFLLMMIIDALRLFGTGAVFCTVKFVPRRVLYFLCSVMTAVCIFCLTSYLYLQTSNLLWFGLMSLVLFIFFSVTLVSTAWSYPSELYPSSVRGLGSSIASSMSFVLLFIIIKVVPGLIDTYGILAFYITCGCITTVCTVILFFVLPETNGKTLQEIENSLNKEKQLGSSIHGKENYRDLPFEQSKL